MNNNPFCDFAFGLNSQSDFKEIGNLIKTCINAYDNTQSIQTKKSLDYDIIQSINQYRIILDIPGVSKDKLNMNLVDTNILVIKIDKINTLPPDFAYKYRSRKDIISSETKINLPEDADYKSIDARYDNGVLTITFNKKISSDTSSSGIKININ
jgi:HSP20 family protein